MYSLTEVIIRLLAKKEEHHAGVLLFCFECLSSPAYLSELFEYLYVGGKYIFPSFHPSKTRPCLRSICSWKKKLSNS